MDQNTSQLFESYLPVYDLVPEKWEEARPFLVEQLKKISNAVNIREIGWFLDEELLSGKAFIPGSNDVLDGGSSQTFRQIFRKVIDFGPLLINGINSAPHFINVNEQFTLIFLGANATDPVGFTALPIPYVDTMALANQIEIYMDATDVYIVTGVPRSNYTRVYVIIEYLLEV
jgi:hypothetical protein